MMTGYGSGNGGWGVWVFMAIMMLVFFALVAAAVIAVIRTSGHGSSPERDSGRNEAMRLLEERFARGDIDADEFAKRRDVLRSR